MSKLPFKITVALSGLFVLAYAFCQAGLPQSFGIG